MAYTPLTPEQFNKAKQAGFTPGRIIQMEQKRKAEQGGMSTSVTPQAPEPKSLLRKVGDFFTASTQKFGKTLGEAINAPKAASMYSSAVDQQIASQNKLLQERARVKSAGGDTRNIDTLLQSQTAPKAEDFTGDVINKTAGQVIGEGIGTGLEALSGGLLSSGRKLIGSKALSTAQKIGEGAKIGATYGAIGGGSGAMQEGGGVADTLKGTATGALLGGGLGGGLGYAGAKVGQAIGNLANRPAILAEQNAQKAKKLTGEILQGKPEDIARGQRVISQTPELSKAKTYQEGFQALDKKVSDLTTKQDKSLQKNLNAKKVKELSVPFKVGEKTIKHNYVDDALRQIDDFYTSTNNQVGKAEIAQLRAKASKKGLTVLEVNNLARLHGNKLNAYNANGQLASGLTKQGAENTRMGLKETVKAVFGNKASRQFDKEISATIRVRDLFREMSEKVNTLEQKIQERSFGAKAGYLIGKVINTLGLGSPKGIVEALIPRGQGFKVMNALDLEKALQKNIKLLQEMGDKTIPENTLIKKLESFLSQNSDSEALRPAQTSITKKINQPIYESVPLIKKKSIPNNSGGFIKTGASQVDDTLIKEAKKYKSAEEFVKSITEDRGGIGKGVEYSPFKRLVETDINDTPLTDFGFKPDDKVIIYRGVDNASQKNINGGDYVATSRELAESYTNGRVISKEVPASHVRFASGDGITAEDFKNGFNETHLEGVYNPKPLIKQFQLTDIYNQAKKGSSEGLISKNPLLVGAGITGGLALGTKSLANKPKNGESLKASLEQKSSNVDAQGNFTGNFVPKDFIEAVAEQESSSGRDKRNEKADQGKYGYLYGFTKPTYQGIVEQAKTQKLYKNLLAKLNFDTPLNAKKSAEAYVNFLMRDFSEDKSGTTPKDINPAELYAKYNGGGSPKGIINFAINWDRNHN